MREKFLKLKSKVSKKIMVLACTTTMLVMTCSSVAFASSTTPTTDTNLDTIKSAITSGISLAAVAGIIASCIASSIGFALLWFGARKLSKTILIAIKSGKIKF